MVQQRKKSSFATLRRFAQPAPQQAPEVQEQCELCSEPIPHVHRHLLEITSREIMCVCQACSILFDRKAASQGKYRLVPDRRLRLESFQMSDAEWDALHVPVGMAFFFHSTPAKKVVAYYPSPMGPTQSLLPLRAWKGLEERNSVLRDMEADVEALLVDRTRGNAQHFLVPIDECYSLTGLVRVHWKGLSGGREVWNEIGQFFDALKQRSKPA